MHDSLFMIVMMPWLDQIFSICASSASAGWSSCKRRIFWSGSHPSWQKYLNFLWERKTALILTILDYSNDSALKPFRRRVITRTNFQSADFPLWTPSCALLSLERGFDESVFKGLKAKLDVEFIQDILKRCLFCPFKICVVLSDWDISKISQNHLWTSTKMIYNTFFLVDESGFS